MEYLLTTVDNPYNPHTNPDNPCANFEQWMQWDIAHGYNTNGYIARILYSKVGYYNPDISPAEKDILFSEVIDEILKNDAAGIFARISANDRTPLVEEAYSKASKWNDIS